MNQSVLPQYFAVLWIPYVLILFYFYNKQNIGAIIILICVGLLNYRLPMIFGLNGRLFEIGLLFCFLLDFMKLIIFGQRPRYHDHIISRTIIIYYLLFLVSALFAKYTSLPNKVYATIDTSLLFFLTIKCIHSRKDVNNLLKGIVFSVSLVAAIGIMGYLVDDPWFGTMSGDNEAIVEARMNKDLSFADKFSLSTELAKGRTWYRKVIVSTTESPNALGVILIFNLFILFYLWFRSKKQKYKVLILGLIVLSVTTLIMTGARTAIIAGVFGFLLLSIRFRKFNIRFRQYVFIVLLLITTLYVLSQNKSIIESTTNKFLQIKSVYDFINAGNRIRRWDYAVSQMTLEMLIIGTGKAGAEGTTGAHNTYLMIIYAGGAWALLAFSIFLLRALRNSLHTYDRFLGLCLFIALIMYAITGITYEHALSLSRGMIFWPIIAILASPVVVDGLPNIYRRVNKIIK